MTKEFDGGKELLVIDTYAEFGVGQTVRVNWIGFTSLRSERPILTYSLPWVESRNMKTKPVAIAQSAQTQSKTRFLCQRFLSTTQPFIWIGLNSSLESGRPITPALCSNTKSADARRPFYPGNTQ